jgi:hypothetical protein
MPNVNWNRHQILDARSLAYHKEIARRLRDDPSLTEHARQNILRWRDQNGESGWMLEWLAILEQPPSAIIQFLCEESENAITLRHSSPFAGILTEAERQAIAARIDEEFDVQ